MLDLRQYRTEMEDALIAKYQGLPTSKEEKIYDALMAGDFGCQQSNVISLISALCDTDFKDPKKDLSVGDFVVVKDDIAMILYIDGPQSSRFKCYVGPKTYSRLLCAGEMTKKGLSRKAVEKFIRALTFPNLLRYYSILVDE